ncbi:MAG: hypothetical protein NZL91_00505 [Thermoflexales bacterium]|nr:hypothetical protein [Thermoflexales bacterium]MDW8394929.1 hypothetical protein [Anaerolineae bacterium]
MACADSPSVLVLYGLDERSLDFEIVSTLALVRSVTEALLARGWRALPLQVTHDLITTLQPFPPSEWVVFNLCEGSIHQAFYYARATRALAEMGYIFTGSDAWTLDETQYKQRMKACLEAASVPTAPWAIVEHPEAIAFEHFPAIVKPSAEHCSYGITRDSVVLTPEEARTQCRRVIHAFQQPALIEAFLDSPEYNVSIWGTAEEARVLAISMMTYDAFPDIHDRLCTFEAKWVVDSEAYQRIPAICPAPLTDELRARIEAVALAAYRATRCRDYGRVDLRLRQGEPMVLDVNANCDVSPEGGFARAAQVAGLSYAEMIEALLISALTRCAAQPARCVAAPIEPSR